MLAVLSGLTWRMGSAPPRSTRWCPPGRERLADDRASPPAGRRRFCEFRWTASFRGSFVDSTLTHKHTCKGGEVNSQGKFTCTINQSHKHFSTGRKRMSEFFSLGCQKFATMNHCFGVAGFGRDYRLYVPMLDCGLMGKKDSLLGLDSWSWGTHIVWKVLSNPRSLGIYFQFVMCDSGWIFRTCCIDGYININSIAIYKNNKTRYNSYGLSRE